MLDAPASTIFSTMVPFQTLVSALWLVLNQTGVVFLFSNLAMSHILTAYS